VLGIIKAVTNYELVRDIKTNPGNIYFYLCSLWLTK
jgi:hypothetical protein